MEWWRQPLTRGNLEVAERVVSFLIAAPVRRVGASDLGESGKHFGRMHSAENIFLPAPYEVRTMSRFGRTITAVVLAMATVSPAVAQHDGYNQGLQHGYRGRNGGYNDQYDHQRYDNRDEYNRTHGGIGPGKGAAIGGAGGAALGALFGGGLKGAIIGGAAGAGVGAIAGKVHQDNKKQDWRDYRDGRRY